MIWSRVLTRRPFGPISASPETGGIRSDRSVGHRCCWRPVASSEAARAGAFSVIEVPARRGPRRDPVPSDLGLPAQ
eukprot:2882802-Pyramimonas_sp.AAC.1